MSPANRLVCPNRPAWEQAEKFSFVDNTFMSRLNNRLLLGLFKSANHIVDFRKLLFDGYSVGFEI